MLQRSIGTRSISMSTAQMPPSDLKWSEIGRAAPDGGAPWIVRIAPVGESGALYQAHIVDGSVFTITVDLIAHRGAPVRRVHRASCRISPDVDASGEPIQRLVKAAEEAAWTVLTASSRDHPRPGSAVGGIDGEGVKRLPAAHRQRTTAASGFDQPIHGP
jgi:hypothetical protein